MIPIEPMFLQVMTCIIQHHMGIRSTKTKGINRRSPQTERWPWCGLEGKLHTQLARLKNERFDQNICGDQRTLSLRYSKSIFGFNFSKFAFGGIMPFSRTRMVLIRAATPLAPSRWPMLDLTEPLSTYGLASFAL